jgi:hypothetical protein
MESRKMREEISILACELRKYSHEQLVQKLATMSIYMVRISRDSQTLDEAADRADAALRNTGISENL